MIAWNCQPVSGDWGKGVGDSLGGRAIPVKSPLPVNHWHGLPRAHSKGWEMHCSLQDTRESQSVDFQDESSRQNSKIPSQHFPFIQKCDQARPEFIGQCLLDCSRFSSYPQALIHEPHASSQLEMDVLFPQQIPPEQEEWEEKLPL